MSKQVPGQKLALPQLTGIHTSHPEIGKALQTILEYINTNVTPVQGTRIQTKTPKAGGNP